MKSVLSFIGITFIATFAIEGWLIADGVRFSGDAMQTAPALWLMGIMWIPGATALLVTKLVEGNSIKKSLSLRIGSLGPYLLTLILVPAAFAAMYGLSWLAGLTAPDTTLSGLTEATGSDTPITMDTVFTFLLPMSAVAGPLINFIFGLGEELGWRGFLLPRLMVLGKWRAYSLLAVLWGVWHAPLVWAEFNYPSHPLAGIGMMIVLCFALGLFLNEMTLHCESVLLAAFIHGAVNAQGFGIWPWLFPDTSPLLGGGTGVTGIIVWMVIGLTSLKLLERLKAKTAQA